MADKRLMDSISMEQGYAVLTPDVQVQLDRIEAKLDEILKSLAWLEEHMPHA